MHFKVESALDYSAVTLPNSEFIGKEKIKIFVFTQERLHFLMSTSPEYIFDYIFVDEAHKLADSYRGILLQHAILRASSPETHIIYASPFSKNPEKLLELHQKIEKKDSVYTPVATVNQNLFWLNQIPRKPKHWDVTHISDSEIIVGKLELNDTPNNARKRLAFLAFEIGQKTGGNVVYANIPSEAEKIAGLLVDKLKNSGTEPAKNEDILDLIELCYKTIHKDFLLINSLKYGVAFHYGNLPQIIRAKIESLFKAGHVKYLVCTSTLVEGVNLSCKNIFVRGPKKGHHTGSSMSKEDFWNLAGRAGRWGQEFQGNVFCIDVSDKNLWPSGAPRKRTPYNITLSVERNLNKIDQVIEYVENGTPRENYADNIETEYLLSYLLEDYFCNDNNEMNSLDSIDSTKKGKLLSEFEKIESALEIPISIVKANPGISPYAMQSLYEYFKSKPDEQIDELVPPHPSSDNSDKELVRVFSRINKYLAPHSFGFTPASTYVLSLLVIKWMNGYSVARLISDRERYLRKKGKEIFIPVIIRGILHDIENIARFRAPKYLACYNDLLSFYLESKGKRDLISHLDNIQLSLEFGVNVKTQLSLISLGISRSSAIEISACISDSEMTPDQVVGWLMRENLESFDVPRLVFKELSKFKESLVS
jgi:hypothetical protein